jgi:hypothetical protein
MNAMLLSVNNADPGLARLEAAALTELALGEDRDDVAFNLICTALGVLAEVDRDGAPVARVARQWRRLAERIER